MASICILTSSGPTGPFSFDSRHQVLCCFHNAFTRPHNILKISPTMTTQISILKKNSETVLVDDFFYTKTLFPITFSHMFPEINHHLLTYEAPPFSCIQGTPTQRHPNDLQHQHQKLRKSQVLPPIQCPNPHVCQRGCVRDSSHTKFK